MTVGNQTVCNNAAATDAVGTNALVLSDATATATAVMAAATADVGAPFLQSNQTMICAPDAAAPEPPADGSVMADPAEQLALEMLGAEC